jgi:PncC family amidohydrolase
MLRAQDLTVGLAESSTGGLVGHRITQISGSSDYFVGSIVPYARQVQVRLAGVSEATLAEHGVVGGPVAREMARGAREQLRADVGVSVTGIASPHTGRSRKPIGLTYIALSAADLEACERYVFHGDRAANKWASSEAALDLLRRYLERHRELPELQRTVDDLDPKAPPQLEIIYPAESSVLKPQSTVRLGVLSSAFNPPTAAHVTLAERATAACDLDMVLLELSKVNVDKRVYGASLAERLWMLWHFAAGMGSAGAGWLAVGAGSHARFVDKAAGLPPTVALYFIVGFDTLVRVFDAEYYTDLEAELRELFDQSQFIVANRGERDVADVHAFLQEPLPQRYADRIHVVALDDFHAGLSSTLVRERLQRGEPIADFVPDAVVRRVSLTQLGQEVCVVMGEA